MTNEKAIETLESIRTAFERDEWMCDDIEALDMAIKALEQEPCEDAISRQAVHHKVLEEWNKVFTDEDIRFSNIADFVIDSPSVTPTHKKGKWIVEPGIGCKCSECGRKPYPYQTDSSGDDYWKPDYCPNCGKEMESEE